MKTLALCMTLLAFVPASAVTHAKKTPARKAKVKVAAPKPVAAPVYASPELHMQLRPDTSSLLPKERITTLPATRGTGLKNIGAEGSGGNLEQYNPSGPPSMSHPAYTPGQGPLGAPGISF
jgi:hypothetical protein